MRRGEVWIISGKTGSGKTSLALQFARNFADNPEHSILFLSLEMKGWELCLRMFCEMNGVTFSDLINGHIEIDQALESTFKKYISNIDFEVVEGGYTFAEVEKVVEQCYKIKKPDIIFLDFVQLVEWKNFGDERVALMEYIRKIKIWANKYNIGFVVVSQIRRLPTGADYNRPPDLIDLKGSGALEQTADKVIFIYKEIDNQTTRYFINLAKNRQGRTVCQQVDFEGQYYRFKDIDNSAAEKVKETFQGRYV